MKRVLSLGAGLQSSVLLLMSARGDLPLLDLAVFADTQWEPSYVYEHLLWLKHQIKGVIPIVEVTAGNLSLQGRSGKGFASIPFHVPSGDGRSMLPRQCTSQYKIRPIETYLRREVIGLKFRQRAPREQVIEQWIGITMDEAHRAKDPAGTPWKTHAFPFLDLVLGNRRAIKFGSEIMTRRACEKWAERNFPGRKFPKSACIGCPYRDDRAWRDMQRNSPETFAQAVAYDASVRPADAPGTRGLVHDRYVHQSLVPLGQAKFNNPDAAPLFGNECEGMCGV